MASAPIEGGKAKRCFSLGLQFLGGLATTKMKIGKKKSTRDGLQIDAEFYEIIF